MLQFDERAVHQGVVHRVFVESGISLPRLHIVAGDYIGDGFFHSVLEFFRIPELGEWSPKWWNNLHQQKLSRNRCFLLPIWLDNQGTFKEVIET